MAAIDRHLGAHPQSPSLRDAWPVIVALGVTEIVSYGSAFYSFSLLMEPLQAMLAASKGTVVGAFSLALAVAGLSAIRIGATIDRIGGRTVMAAGSVAMGVLLMLAARIETVAGLYAIYACIGVAMAATLYEPAFAVLTRHFRSNARRAITALTLIAGFSSTVFWPLTQALIAHFGWRESLVMLGAVNLLVCLPLHLCFVPRRGAHAGAIHASESGRDGSKTLQQALRSPAFYFLGGTFVVHGVVFSVLSVHLLAMLQSKGMSATAAAAAGALVGPMQVVGRVLELTAGQRVPIARVGLLAMVVLVIAFLVFATAGTSAGLLIAVVCLYGLSNGVVTIVRGAMPALLFGHRHYGTISGALAVPQMFALASGPFLVSLLWMATGGYGTVLYVLALVSAAGLVSFYLALRAHRT
ncbi:MAG TPA: MFS transporter [Burkholderiales bacterium]|nr:MFS transporter [Burkholderiales bacterium]